MQIKTETSSFLLASSGISHLFVFAFESVFPLLSQDLMNQFRNLNGKLYLWRIVELVFCVEVSCMLTV